MPSVTETSVERPSNEETVNSLNNLGTSLEKKIRNLEKRKSKIETYKQELSEGKELNEDQKAAIGRYEEINGTLEMAREVFKSITQITTEAKKVPPPRVRKVSQPTPAPPPKKEQTENRTQHELLRIRHLLAIQDVLLRIELEKEIREDFLLGRNGAVRLTEAQLAQLTELCKIVCPSRLDHYNETVTPETIPRKMAQAFNNRLKNSSENIINLLDQKTVEFHGTNFKQLKELLKSIQDCGYFERRRLAAALSALSSAASTNGPTVNGSGSADKQPESVMHQNPTGQISDMSYAKSNQSYFSAGAGAQQGVTNYQSGATGPQMGQGNTVVPTRTTTPGIQEIVSQSSINFLQDSRIIEMEGAQHVDPAIVAVANQVPASYGPLTVDPNRSDVMHGANSDTAGVVLNHQNISPVSPVLYHQQLQSQSYSNAQSYSNQTYNMSPPYYATNVIPPSQQQVASFVTPTVVPNLNAAAAALQQQHQGGSAYGGGGSFESDASAPQAAAFVTNEEIGTYGSSQDLDEGNATYEIGHFGPEVNDDSDRKGDSWQDGGYQGSRNYDGQGDRRSGGYRNRPSSGYQGGNSAGGAYRSGGRSGGSGGGYMSNGRGGGNSGGSGGGSGRSYYNEGRDGGSYGSRGGYGSYESRPSRGAGGGGGGRPSMGQNNGGRDYRSGPSRQSGSGGGTRNYSSQPNRSHSET